MVFSILLVFVQIGVALIMPAVIIYTALPAKRPEN